MKSKAGIPHWVSLFDADVHQHHQHPSQAKQDPASTDQPPGSLRDGSPSAQTSHTTSSASSPETESYTSFFTITPLPAVRGSLGSLPGRKTWDQEDLRTRKTCLYVLLGVLCLSLVAMVTAILLHFRPEKLAYVSMADVTTTAGNTAATLECQVRQLPDLEQVTILRDGGNDYLAILTLNPEATQWVKDRSRTLLNVVHFPDSLRLLLSVEAPSCQDEGKYECRAVSKQGVFSDIASLTLRVHPEKPELHLPVEVVEGRPFRVRSVWKGGYPSLPGFLAIRRFGSDRSYLPQTTFSDYSESIRRENCSLVLESSYLFLPTMEWNATTLRVSVVPHPGLSEEEKLAVDRLSAATVEVLVVRVDYCTGVKNSSSIPHPYTCQKFVRCLDGAPHVFACQPGLCFNLTTRSCLPSQ